MGISGRRLGDRIRACFTRYPLARSPWPLLPNLVAPCQSLARSRFKAAAARLIIAPALQIGREMLLFDLGIRVVVSIFVAPTIAQILHQLRRSIAQVQWHR